MRTHPLVAHTEARAAATRDAALAQGLARFPPEGGGPLTPDRYVWPDTFTLDLWRAVRQAPIERTVTQ
jgi:hypothetical protein